jgi:tRNA(Arg) A34 adenosine deaminase TadA
VRRHHRKALVLFGAVGIHIKDIGIRAENSSSNSKNTSTHPNINESRSANKIVLS